MTPKHWIDHIAIATNEPRRVLARLGEEFRALPRIHGRHPHRGTETSMFALGGLGAVQYVEVISVIDTEAEGGRWLRAQLADGHDRLVAFCLAAPDVVADAEGRGLVTSAGGRVNEDGSKATWVTARAPHWYESPGLAYYIARTADDGDAARLAAADPHWSLTDVTVAGVDDQPSGDVVRTVEGPRAGLVSAGLAGPEGRASIVATSEGIEFRHES